MSGDPDYATELSGEVLATLFDSFMALFNTIWSQRSSSAAGIQNNFRLLQFLNHKIHVCKSPETIEYIEMCSKKLAVLLCSNALDGFHMDLITAQGIVQRFVFIINGKLSFAKFDRISGQELLRSIESSTELALKQFTQLEKKMEKFNLKRFQIVFGLHEATMQTYQDFPHGLFQMDTDLELFPWSKPKSKPKGSDTQFFLDYKKNMLLPCSLGPTPPRASAKENSPSPELDTDEEIKSLRSTPGIFPKNSDNTLSKSDDLLLPQIIKEKGTSVTESDITSIHDMTFGNIRLNFYSLFYEVPKSQKLNSMTTTGNSTFSPKSINSPGEYRSGHGNLMEYFERKDSPTTGGRTPPSSAGRRFRSSEAGGTPTQTSPLSSTPPSCRRVRTAQSSRSLAAEFEEALRNDTQSRGVPVSSTISPRSRPPPLPLALPPLRSFRSARRRT